MVWEICWSLPWGNGGCLYW